MLRITPSLVGVLLLSLGIAPTAEADPKPIGLGCDPGYTLVIKDNLLTCQGEAVGYARTCKPFGPNTIITKSEYVVQAGQDKCLKYTPNGKMLWELKECEPGTTAAVDKIAAKKLVHQDACMVPDYRAPK